MTQAGVGEGEGFAEGFGKAAEEHMPGWLKNIFKAFDRDNAPGAGAIDELWDQDNHRAP